MEQNFLFFSFFRAPPAPSLTCTRYYCPSHLCPRQFRRGSGERTFMQDTEFLTMSEEAEKNTRPSHVKDIVDLES